MKLLHLPLNVPGSEQVGQEKGFRAVFEEYDAFDYLLEEGRNGKTGTNQALIARVYETKPDIIWVQLQTTDTITPDTWKIIKEKNPAIWLTTWSGDARSEVSEVQKQYLPYFDVFYNCTDQKMYEQYAKRIEFMPIAIDPDEATNFNHPMDNPKPREIVFLGNNYGNTFTNGEFRHDLMVSLSRQYTDKFGVYGTGWGSDVENMGTTPLKHQGAYYEASKVVVSVDHIKDILHWSERILWAMASGTPTVMQRQPGIERHFGKHGEYVLYFDTIGECVRQIEKILENPILYAAMGRRAKTKVLSNDIWKVRANNVAFDYESKEK